MLQEDLDFIAEMLSDPNVMKYYPKQLSREESEEWIDRQIERYKRDGHGLWLVEEKLSGMKVGQVGLVMQLIESKDIPEIGYLVHAPFWRRGYASEAAIVVKEYAFGKLGYQDVISLIRPENKASQGVAKKLGMEPQKEINFKGNNLHVYFVSKVI